MCEHKWEFSSYDNEGTRYRCVSCGELREESPTEDIEKDD